MSNVIKFSPKVLIRLSSYDEKDLGPHAQSVWRELRCAAEFQLPLVVVVLAAALVDLVQHEVAGPAGYYDGAAFCFAGNKAALGWLRGRRNSILHYEQPTDGLMNEADAAGWLTADAERAIITLMDYLADLEITGPV